MKTELNDAIKKAYCEYLDERGIDFYSQYVVDSLESNLLRLFILYTRGNLYEIHNFEELLIDLNNFIINDK